MPFEQHIKLTAKLYQCRDTARKIHKEKFAEKMAQYHGYIRAYMEKSQTDELKAAMNIAEHFNDGYVSMMVMAAYVEMIEPTENKIHE